MNKGNGEFSDVRKILKAASAKCPPIHGVQAASSIDSLTVGLMPLRTVFRSPIRRSPSYTLANRGSIVPLPDLACAAKAAAPVFEDGAAPAAVALASPARGLMYSLSSLAPSSQVIRSSLSINPKFCTLPLDPFAARSSLSVVAEALYSGIASSRLSQAK